MFSRRQIAVAVVLAVVILVLPPAALAGPGGAIAKAITKSFWGRVGLVALAVVFAPLIAWVLFCEWRAHRRTLADLKRLASVDPRFHPLAVDQRLRECFHRVHSAWSRETMHEASAVMTSWYLQNQQMAHLDRWEREGLVNHCRVSAIRSVKPLNLRALVVRGEVQAASIAIAVDAKMEDYLAERGTGRVVEGEKGEKSVETIWTLLLEDGILKVQQIDEGSTSLAYARAGNEVVGLVPKAAPAG